MLDPTHAQVLKAEDGTFYNEGGDAIQVVKTDNRQSDVIYDLSGRRVEKMVKGIYIVNGKKVLK